MRRPVADYPLDSLRRIVGDWGPPAGVVLILLLLAGPLPAVGGPPSAATAAVPIPAGLRADGSGVPHIGAAVPSVPTGTSWLPPTVRTCPGPAVRFAPPCPSVDLAPPANSDANSTPVPEVGAVVASVSLSGSPAQTAFDTNSNDIYLLDSKSSNVSVLHGTSLVATVQVGSTPSGLVYDPSNGYVYVSVPASRSVSVLNGTSILTTISVGGSPVGGVYDPADGFVYIPNSASGNVSVINDTRLETSLPVGTGPGPPIYDPAHHLVYVPDLAGSEISIVADGLNVANVSVYYGALGGIVFDPYDSQVYFTSTSYGYTTLSAYNGTTLNASGVAVGGTGSAMACDPRTGAVYVADAGAASVQVIRGFNIVATLTVGTGPREMSFDPASGRVYVANAGGNNVSVLNGTSVAGSVKVGAGPFEVDPLPGTSLLVASVAGAHALSLISTALAIGPSALSPPGDPASSVDLGQSFAVNASLWGLGSGGLVASSIVAPSYGLGCGASPTVAADAYLDHVELACTPASAGSFLVTLNVTDSSGNSVWSRLAVTVYSAPSAGAPIAAAGGRTGVVAADVGEPVDFVVPAAGGSGRYAFNWSVPMATCNATAVPDPACTFRSSGPVAVSVGITDSNGVTVDSPALAFRADPALSAPVPTATFPSADVGENITFAEAPIGGSGGYANFSWSGLPLGACTLSGTAHPLCGLAYAENLSIGVRVEDANGAWAASPTLAFRVYPRPILGPLTATRSALDVGQSVYFVTQGTGGAGPLEYGWQNLPTGCSGIATAAPACAPTAPGSFDVRAVALDANGGTSLPSNIVGVAVFADPFASAPTLSAPEVRVGTSVQLNVSIRGGGGENVVNWSGLPDHCNVQGMHVSCVPTVAGRYPIAVDVTDRNGFLAPSNVSILTVSPPPPGGGTGGSSGFALGGSMAGYLVLGIFAVVVVGVVAVGLRYRRPRPPPDAPGDDATPTDGGPP